MTFANFLFSQSTIIAFVLFVALILELTKPEQTDNSTYATARRRIAEWMSLKKAKFAKWRKTTHEDRIAEGKFIGWRISAFQWNVIVRPILSVLAGLAIACTLFIIDALVGSDILDFTIVSLLTMLFASVFAVSDGTETVPSAHAAMLTFFGKRIRVYRMEGNYWWTGEKLFLGRYKPAPGASVQVPAIVDSSGFINLGDVPVSIWDRKDRKDVVLMELVASDSTTIQATLVVELRVLNPWEWTQNEDPILAIAERARSAFRTAASFFTAEDNAAVKSVLGTLMSGHTLISSFLNKVVGSDPRKTIIRDMAGVAMYAIVRQPVSDRHIEETKGVFRERLVKDADRSMLESIKNGSEYSIETRSVEDALEEVVEGVGATLIRASVGTLILPGEITAAANKAASETRQREGQVASARAFAAAKKIMDEAKTSGDEVAAAIAAAADNPNIKVIFVPGADPLTRAAVAAATQINGGTK